MSALADLLPRERLAEIVPPAQHQTTVPAKELLHTANAGVVIEKVGQVRSEFRNEARMFARQMCEHVNTKQVGIASAFLYEESFGAEDRLHWLIHLRSFESYYRLVEMGDRDRAYRASLQDDLVTTQTGGGAWDKLFVDGSLHSTVMVPQFWGMHGTRAENGGLTKELKIGDTPVARDQTTQLDDEILHSGSAGIVLHRKARASFEYRSEARQFAREVAESINRNLSGEATVFVFEEAFGAAETLHWMIHLRDMTTYYHLLNLHSRDEDVRKVYFRERIAAQRGGGTWAKAFLDGTMNDVALTPHHWGLYATKDAKGA